MALATTVEYRKIVSSVIPTYNVWTNKSIDDNHRRVRHYVCAGAEQVAVLVRKELARQGFDNVVDTTNGYISSRCRYVK